ncbi:MAG: zinc ABC transporter substrate-binding protein [Desulfobacterales bacterium]|nr:metal ABC transporter substrate-binding protein [Deltaproteobacteria bacterium]NNL78542.1 zinc ABC transporter substrate-binding protein [Desulfobacterales bacterium]
MYINDSLKKVFVINIVFIFLAVHSSIAAEQLTVCVVNYPLHYFAERIGGEHINVVFPAPADVDPAYWMPDTPTIAAYQQADLILLNGAHYAKWINKVTLPRFKMVNTSAGFKDQYIESTEIFTHSHGSEGEHAHESLAFTTWMSFNFAAKQAKAIAEALSRKRPELSDIYKKNYAALERDLMALDRTVKEIVSKDRVRPLMVSHPVYDYFARRYGLIIKSVHWEPDEILTNEHMKELNRILKEHPAKWMIWEGKPKKESVERLRAIGVDSLVFNPCGNTPDQGDFLSIMRQNVENLTPVFE